MPQLRMDNSILSTSKTGTVLSACEPLPSMSVQHNGHTTELLVKLPTEDDNYTIEGMIRQCAQDGEGFALDEFTENGTFNSRMLWDRNTLVVKSPEGKHVAAVVFGSTSLCRSPKSGQLGVYIIVEKDFRRQNVGVNLLQYCIEHAQRLGYKAILSDVFASNDIAVNLVLRAGFHVIGTLPYCAYVKDSGYTDSLIVHKRFDRDSISAKL